jgi:hypothetical protein
VILIFLESLFIKYVLPLIIIKTKNNIVKKPALLPSLISKASKK